MNSRTVKRPAFDDALALWNDALARAGCHTPTRWLFRENLCLLAKQPGDEDFRIAFESGVDPVGENDARRLYDEAAADGEFMIFYAAVVEPGRTYSTFLNDSFSVDEIDTLGDKDLHFCVGEPFSLCVEMQDELQWRLAKKRENNSMSPLDFVYVSNFSRCVYWREWFMYSLGLRQ